MLLHIIAEILGTSFANLDVPARFKGQGMAAM